MIPGFLPTAIATDCAGMGAVLKCCGPAPLERVFSRPSRGKTTKQRTMFFPAGIPQLVALRDIFPLAMIGLRQTAPLFSTSMHLPTLEMPTHDRFSPDFDPSFWDGGAAAAPAPDDAIMGSFTAGKVGPVNVEAMAALHDFLPVKLPRSTCSIPGESLLRQLGRMATTADPWLPVGTVGPFLIMGHCRPGSTDYWGVSDSISSSLS